MYLFKKSPFLDDVWNCFHFDAFCLVNVFEGVELACLFVLYDTDLGKKIRMR